MQVIRFNAPNDIFKNWNKSIYIANKNKEVEIDDYNNEIVTYKKPFYFGKVNYQPLTRKDLEAFMQQYGETTNKIVSFLANYNTLGKFKEFDVAYLYGASPKGEKKYGDNANYIIRAYKPQNTKIMVILEEIIKEEI